MSAARYHGMELEPQDFRAGLNETEPTAAALSTWIQGAGMWSRAVRLRWRNLMGLGGGGPVVLLLNDGGAALLVGVNAEAKVVLVSGLGFEGWMARLAKASGSKALTVVASTGVKPRKIHFFGFFLIFGDDEIAFDITASPQRPRQDLSSFETKPDGEREAQQGDGEEPGQHHFFSGRSGARPCVRRTWSMSSRGGRACSWRAWGCPATSWWATATSLTSTWTCSTAVPC